jgi:DNA mismatch repair protein MLH3
VLTQASLITPADWKLWIPSAASTQKIAIDGVICLEPAPTKHAQFISLGIRPLGSQDGGSILYEEINRIFSNSSFGNGDGEAELDEMERLRKSADSRYKSDGYTSKQPRGWRKGVNRWPSFYLCINVLDISSPTANSDESLLLEDYRGSLGATVELLRAVVTAFLREHHFYPKERRNTTLVTGKDLSIASEMAEQHSESPLRVATRSKDREPKMDIGSRILGTNIQLPLFSQNRSMPSGDASSNYFSDWARIKSGRIRSGRSKSIQKDAGKQPCQSGEINILKPASESELPENNTGTGAFGTPRTSGQTLKSQQLEKIDIGTFATSSMTMEEIESQPLTPFKASHLHSPENEPEAVMDPESPTSDANDPTDALLSWASPKTKQKAIVSSRTGHIALPQPNTTSSKPETPSITARTPSTWVNSLLQSWDNPMHNLMEAPIPPMSLASSNIDSENVLYRYHNCSPSMIEQAPEESSSLLAARLSKGALKSAQVIAQVDKKFILAKMHASKVTFDSDLPTCNDNQLMVIIDQHAADERCRIEGLLAELCDTSLESRASQPGGVACAVQTTILDRPISVQVSLQEHSLFEKYIKHFANWGILYDAVDPSNNSAIDELQNQHRIDVKALPPGIAERCRTEIRSLVDLMRSEVWRKNEAGGRIRIDVDASTRDDHARTLNRETISDMSPQDEKHAWIRRVGDCPRGILEILNSRACRSKPHSSIEPCRNADPSRCDNV